MASSEFDSAIELADPALYVNRELSLLEFQRRVLEEAHDENNPLLERVKFLAIFGSNMDEFFMVRVSGIRKQVEARITEVSPDGLTRAISWRRSASWRRSCTRKHTPRCVGSFCRSWTSPESTCWTMTS